MAQLDWNKGKVLGPGDLSAYGVRPQPGPLQAPQPINPNAEQAKEATRQSLNPPVNLKDLVTQGLNKADVVLQRAREETGKMMVPPTVPQDAPMRKVAEAINPVPGSLPSAAGMAAAMAMPGGTTITGPLRRAAAGGLAAGATAAAQGKPDPLMTGLGFAGSQLTAETPFAVGRMWRGPEKIAKSLVKEFKGKVPAWAEVPETAGGLTDIVYGKGQRLLSEAYDKSLADVVSIGRGRNVAIPIPDAVTLGLEPRAQVAGPITGRAELAQVDAAELAQAITGRWKKDPGLYRRAAEALDRAGIGDPQARGQYKTGQGLIQYASRTKMMEGGKLDVGKMKGGLTQTKAVDELRRRGLGDVQRGPIAEAAKGIRTIPGKPHPWVTSLGMIEAPIAIASGHPGAAVGGLGAAALGSLPGSSVVTRPPEPGSLEFLLRALATAGGEPLRQATGQ